MEKHFQHDARDSLLRLRVAGKIVCVVAECAVDAETLIEHVHPALQLLLGFDEGKDLKISSPRWFRFLLRVYFVMYQEAANPDCYENRKHKPVLFQHHVSIFKTLTG